MFKYTLNYLVCFLSFLCLSSQALSQRADTGDRGAPDIQTKLDSMGVILPAVAEPVANYRNAIVSGNLVFLSGKGPRSDEGKILTGKLGLDTTVKEGYAAARRVAIMQLAVLKETIGDLNRVKQIVKVTGMVNATDDFTEHPEVINGFSDFMEAVFGERGKHARAAVGMSSLPRGMICEIEMIVEIE